MNEQDLRTRAAIEELQIIINFLTQRCINLRGDALILAAKAEGEKPDKPPLKAVD